MHLLPSIAALAVLFALSACSGTITGTAVDGASDVAVDAVDAPLSKTADAQADSVSDGGDAPAPPPRTTASPGRRLSLLAGQTFVLNANQDWYGWGRVNLTFGDDAATPETAVTRLDLDERNYAHWFNGSTVCRVTRTGPHSAQCWGSNDRAQLGIGPPGVRRTEPQDVPLVTGLRYITTGPCMASTDDGVYWWRQAPPSTDPAETYWPQRVRLTPVCAMSSEVLGTTVAYDCATRNIITWRVESSVRGNRTVEERRPLDDVSMLTSMAGSLLAIRGDGSLWCRGDCVRTPGRSESDNHEAFEPIRGLPPLKYVVGYSVTFGACGITLQDEVVCWGSCRANPILGSGCDPDTRTSAWIGPTRIPELSEVSELASSRNHACALTRRHELWCWGTNYGQETVPGSDATLVFHPVRIDVPNL